MTRYEVVVGGESDYQLIIECRSKRHAIEIFRVLSRAKCVLGDLEDWQGNQVPFTEIAIHGHGRFMGDDDAWTVLGVNWNNKNRIDFAHPEKDFEDLGSVTI